MWVSYTCLVCCHIHNLLIFPLIKSLFTCMQMSLGVILKYIKETNFLVRHLNEQSCYMQLDVTVIRL